MNRREALQAQGPLPAPRARATEEYNTKMAQWEEANEQFREKYSCGETLRDIILEGLTTSTQRWFEQGDAEEEIQKAKHLLQDQGLTSVDEEVSNEEFSVAFLLWGRTVLQEVYAEWASGYAEQIAKAAFTELVYDMEIFSGERKVDEMEREARAQYADKLREDAEPIPHRAVRRGPTHRRGGHKSVKPHVEKYNDDDGWHERWRGYKLEFGVKDQKMPFYQCIAARPIYLVLHLFSGRRREEDFHWYLASMTQHANFNIHVLSLDTAICGPATRRKDLVRIGGAAMLHMMTMAAQFDGLDRYGTLRDRGGFLRGPPGSYDNSSLCGFTVGIAGDGGDDLLAHFWRQFPK